MEDFIFCAVLTLFVKNHYHRCLTGCYIDIVSFKNKYIRIIVSPDFVLVSLSLTLSKKF